MEKYHAKGGPQVDNDKVTMVLVEALFFGDKKSASRWGISVRTVENYRRRLKTDSELVRLFDIKKSQFQKDWIEEVPAAMRGGIRFLLDAFNQLAPTPENIHATAGALKILADIGITKEVFDFELREFHQSQAEEMEKMVINATSESSNT